MQVSIHRSKVRFMHHIEVAIDFFFVIEDLTTLRAHVLPRFGFGGTSALNHLTH